MQSQIFDVIIIGGSYAGLPAGMALGRALRKVLIIDSGKPCNKQTPHSHNFLTQDGKTPAEITAIARAQVAAYDTITFYNGLAIHGTKQENGFEILTEGGDLFRTKKLIFATGITDLMPPLQGFAPCWGISIIHCPYCHGYEVRDAPTGILGNGDYGFEFSKMIANWTKNLTLFTNGPSTLLAEQKDKLIKHHIPIVQKEIRELEHIKGQLQNIIFTDSTTTAVKVLYARPAFVQHSDLPQKLGCALTKTGHIQVDGFQKTTVPGIFACGDNANLMRSVSNAVAMGTFAGAMANKELIDEEF